MLVVGTYKLQMEVTIPTADIQWGCQVVPFAAAFYFLTFSLHK